MKQTKRAKKERGISVKLDPDSYAALKRMAEANERSITRQLKIMIARQNGASE